MNIKGSKCIFHYQYIPNRGRLAGKSQEAKHKHLIESHINNFRVCGIGKIVVC